MKQEHREMLDFALAGIDHKPSFPERSFYAERERSKPAGRAKNEMRTPLPGRSLMIPHLMRSGIFALSDKTAADQRKAPVPKYDDVSDITQGSTVEYKGARLRQFDMRVLLGAMQMAGGMACEAAELRFHADDFLPAIGKPVSTDSVEALRDSLTSLRSATFIVKQYAKDRGVAFGFIDHVSWDKRDFVVRLSPLAHKAFDALGFSLVPMAARNALSDGIQTALADIFASSSATSYDISALAMVFGRGNVDQFGREVREHLPAMVKAGVLTSWSKTRGRIHIVRPTP